MPDSFASSPYADDPHIQGAALITGHDRYAAWFADPTDPAYAGRVAAYRAMTERLNGIETAAATAKDFPPLAQQVRGLATSLGRFVASGGKTTTKAEQERRLSICAECPHYAAGKCTLCGCVTKWKARLASSHCPDTPPRW